MVLRKKSKAFAGVVAGLFLLAIIVGAWIVRFELKAQGPLAVAARTAKSAPKLRLLLGEPMHVSRLVKGNLISGGGYGNADLIIQIRGPLGNGTLYEWAQEEHGRWYICSLDFRPNPDSITTSLSDSDAKHCERE